MTKQVLDVQQMQHLQELGLELKETTLIYAGGGGKYGLFLTKQIDKILWESTYPAYSLQDVLDALPKYYHIANIGWRTKLSIRVHTTKEWEIGYVYTDEPSKYAYRCRILGKELIDAAYELLCWAIENKFLETNKNE
jgi:hypothetical protein